MPLLDNSGATAAQQGGGNTTNKSNSTALTTRATSKKEAMLCLLQRDPVGLARVMAAVMVNQQSAGVVMPGAAA